MFRDEGTQPSIEFKQRMRDRVDRTPTGLLVTAMPFLAAVRIFLLARGIYVQSRCKVQCREINVADDLRSVVARKWPNASLY